jgi:hypothetical protein
MYITKYLKSQTERIKLDLKHIRFVEFKLEVNGEKLANEIEEILNDFAKNNIELVSITPITSGFLGYGGDGGLGYGITDGVIIVGKKDE